MAGRECYHCKQWVEEGEAHDWSKTKVAHLLQISHRDEVEAPFTGWLQEAYGLSDAPGARPPARRAKPRPKRTAKSARRAGTVTAKPKRR